VHENAESVNSFETRLAVVVVQYVGDDSGGPLAESGRNGANFNAGLGEDLVGIVRRLGEENAVTESLNAVRDESLGRGLPTTGFDRRAI